MVSVTENYSTPLTSNHRHCDKATFSACNVQCKDNVSGRSIRVFEKTPVPLTSTASKGPSPIHANPIEPAPWPEKKKEVSPQMLHCGSVQTKNSQHIFKGAPFSPRMSPSVALSLFILFFTGLILNAGIKEASKSWREADVWWGWHRWNEAHFSADQPTSLFSLPLSLNVSVSRCERTWQPGIPSNTWLLWINKKQLILEAVCCISLQLMRPPMAWDK